MLQREGAERTEPLAIRFRSQSAAPSVSRLRGRLRSSVAPTCADSASPGLAAVPGRRPSRTEAIPNAHGFRVFPSARRPSEPRRPHASRLMARSFLNRRLPFGVNHPATHWTFRSGLPCGKQLLKHYRSINPISFICFSRVILRGIPARTSIFEIFPFSTWSRRHMSR